MKLLLQTLRRRGGAGAQEDLAADEDRFRRAHPTYASTALLDELRRWEYRRLDEGEHVYLDYTGGSLYAQSQLDEHLRMMRDSVLGNPHSANPTSATSVGVAHTAGPFSSGLSSKGQSLHASASSLALRRASIASSRPEPTCDAKRSLPFSQWPTSSAASSRERLLRV